MRQLILDTETTGFDPSQGHRIIEFSALEVINRELTGKFLHFYFNPERDIPEDATKVHGITWEQVKDKPVFKEQVGEILDFIADSELIIHNAKFDLNFLDHHFKELGLNTTISYVSSVVDTLLIARNKFPGAKNNLDALCDRFKVDRANRSYHGALIDCELLYYVYINLTREQVSFNFEDKKAVKSKAKKAIDFTQYDLVKAGLTDAEQVDHEKYLATLDQENNHATLWLKAKCK